MKVSIHVIIYLVLTKVLAEIIPVIKTQSNCSFGYFQTKRGTCVECLTTCAKCNNLSDGCQECTEGYRLNNQTGYCQQCFQGQLTCVKQQPIKCQRYYRLMNKQCKLKCLIENCQDCQNIRMDKCNQCYSGFILQNTTICISIISKVRYLQIQQIAQFSSTEVKIINSTVNESFLSNSQSNQINQSSQDNQSRQINQNLIMVSSQNKLISDQDCPINMYANRINNQCSKCGYKCTTCINNPDQCLECSQDRVKLGWKCVTAEHLSFNFSLTVPKIHQTTALTDSIDSFKKVLLSRALPVSYRSKQLITLTKYEYNPDIGDLKLSGVIDILPNIDSAKLKQNILNKFGVLGQKIGDYYTVKTEIEQVKPSILNRTEKVDEKSISNSNESPNEQEKKVENKPIDLVMILVPSLFGSFFLIGLALFAVCCACPSKVAPLLLVINQRNVDNHKVGQKPVQHPKFQILTSQQYKNHMSDKNTE